MCWKNRLEEGCSNGPSETEAVLSECSVGKKRRGLSHVRNSIICKTFILR